MSSKKDSFSHTSMENKAIPKNDGQQQNSSLSRIQLFFLTTVISSIIIVPFTGISSLSHFQNRLLNLFVENNEVLEHSTPLIPKYQSELAFIVPQQHLVPNGCQHVPHILSQNVSVLEAMKSHEKLKEDKKVFVMLNGRNEGLFLSWDSTKQQNCLYEIADIAAKNLGADLAIMSNGLKLFSQMGHPIISAAQLQKAGLIAHVLLDGQLWVWPGIEIGYVYSIDNNIQLKTLSLYPKVFSVENFFDLHEARRIIELGEKDLQRSKTRGADAYEENPVRTSHTAFLEDSNFTRDFRMRSTKLARLPSPAYAERLQLVRYEAGQFYKKHADYFESKDFFNKQGRAMKEYRNWISWASKKCLELEDDLPPEFKVGGKLFPRETDGDLFDLEVLKLFAEDGKVSGYFSGRSEDEWGTWIEANANRGARGIMPTLMKSKANYLIEIIRAWEKRLGRSDVIYRIPRARADGASQYFRWIAWAKEKISVLKDKIHHDARPGGYLYPSFERKFQRVMTNALIQDYSQEELGVDNETYSFIQSGTSSDTLLLLVSKEESIMDKVIQSWEQRSKLQLNYKMPKYLIDTAPQRFATLFLYLNTVPEGGETVFPFSKEKLATDIQRTGMTECSEGLAVPAIQLKASLFYSQTPEMEVDPSSFHGGCPPEQGTKYGSNSFMWNADADEGADAWSP